ncbi:uncharacterized protein EV420DRAFT_1021708 [Desarmillaria tabescens]|uniref:F-box domain-containing protein n=1 Tax=Armillaria tabescens TaxID=1929756 RepID=A0AA39JJ01_ARMTA|nr:uncharacterized protein EV420DRAFT_1021708 [Desarmillaria tabescens]KAK0443662.1 hypothetical protein EV420DRAFT_1021708 [Desarmillaria tabescens]
MFSSLPVELLCKIASLLSLEDGKNLRLTSKKLCGLATPLVFQAVSLSLNEERRYQECMSFLEALASRVYLARHIQTLYIHGSFDPPYGKGGFWYEITNGRQRAIRLIEKRLLGGIPSLVSLRSLYFSGFHPGELGLDSVNAIMFALSNLPLLSLLNIGLHHGQASYLDFHDLDNISFNGKHGLDIIPTLVARSPNLTRLRLSSPHQTRAVPEAALGIFSGLRKGKLSRVKQLTLEGALILPTHDVPIIVPHLRHLTSLRIHITDVAEEFWSALRIEMIHLEDVSVDIVNDALLEYLGSYSGSRTMMLITEQELDHGSPEFWRNILPKHADTLVELYVQPEYAGRWCLDTRSLDAIRQCKRLEILRVKVDQEKLDVSDKTNIIVSPYVRLHV